jgi:hypothetical protein
MSQVNVQEEQNFRMIIKGTARDAHEKFPIRFDYSEKGNAFFIGCRVEAEVTLSNGNTITKKMDIRAFNEHAEALAHVSDGTEITVVGEYGLQKSEKDGRYYPIVTVDEVLA